MNNENTYILEVCKFIDPNKDKIEELMTENLDYPYILGQLLFNRMGAVAYYTLKECGLLKKLNREFRNTIKIVYDEGIEKNKTTSDILEEISNIFDEVDIPYALLKGAFLSTLYPEGLRTSNDVDILLKKENLSLFTEKLKLYGFSQGSIQNEIFVPATRIEIISSQLNRGETVPFIKKLDIPKMKYLELDINFSLDYKSFGSEDNVNKFLKNSYKGIGEKLYTLSVSDFIIHLCVHLFKEATVISWVNMGRDLSLYKFCDIYLFLNKFGNHEFYENLKQSIIGYGLQKESYYALYGSKILFDIESEELDKLLALIRPESLSFIDQVIDPQTNKTFIYDISFKDRVFYQKRREHLYEITNG